MGVAAMDSPDSVYAVPVLGKVLIYAPLHNLAALVNPGATRLLRDSLYRDETHISGELASIARTIRNDGTSPPQRRKGEVVPSLLGLLPTRACNLACKYCGFTASAEPELTMNVKLAEDAVNWYMSVLQKVGADRALLHYFGGEPFCAGDVLEKSVCLARRRAEEIGCALRIEVTTNGFFSAEWCDWAAKQLDTVVLSLDGPYDIQDLHRPSRSGLGSHETVERNAKALSASPVELFLRSCVTGETVGRVPEIATWFCDEFRPTGVSFEPLQPSVQSMSANMEPPDPWCFAQAFVEAAHVLESQGVQPVYAGANVHSIDLSFCPVARDAVIVSGDGSVQACYLLPREWKKKGLEMRMGFIEGTDVVFDPEAVASVRDLNVHNKTLCQRCFSKWHCAGGCHVNHDTSHPPGAYDRLCIQTRIISLRNVLRTMGQDALVSEWLADREAMEESVLRASDLLADWEGAV
jgi:uncharacterized protein